MTLEEIKKQYNPVEFVQGQQDCEQGKPHKDGTESYNAGYATQYELEQIKEAL